MKKFITHIAGLVVLLSVAENVGGAQY